MLKRSELGLSTFSSKTGNRTEPKFLIFSVSQFGIGFYI